MRLATFALAALLLAACLPRPTVSPLCWLAGRLCDWNTRLLC